LLSSPVLPQVDDGHRARLASTELVPTVVLDADPTQPDGDIEPDVTSQMTPLKQQSQQQLNDETHVLQPEHEGDDGHKQQQQQQDEDAEAAAAAAGAGPRESVSPAESARRSSSPHTAAAPAGPDEVTDQQEREQQGGHQSPMPPQNAGGLSTGPGAAAETEAAPGAGSLTVTPGAADREQGQQQEEEVQGRGAAPEGGTGAGAQQANRAVSGGVSDGVLVPGVQPLAFEMGTLIDTTQAVSAGGCWPAPVLLNA
jgi:hypothetical protein